MKVPQRDTSKISPSSFDFRKLPLIYYSARQIWTPLPIVLWDQEMEHFGAIGRSGDSRTKDFSNAKRNH